MDIGTETTSMNQILNGILQSLRTLPVSKFLLIRITGFLVVISPYPFTLTVPSIIQSFQTISNNQFMLYTENFVANKTEMSVKVSSIPIRFRIR